MSGHSKWSTIKRKKGAADAKRGKVFSKLAKEITVAARHGCGDPKGNPRLRTVLLVARSNNMPMDNVERAIKKGTGELPGVTYDEITYEGYGPGGVAVLVDVMTDNKNRSVSDIRHILSKHGGSMAESGAVSWNFERKGIITVAKDSLSEEDIFEKAIEAGADDVDTSGDVYRVTTGPSDLHLVSEGLQGMGVTVDSAELTMEPKTTIKIEGKTAETVLKLMDMLEDNEDVQNVYANFDISEEDMAALMGE
ncbi:MAG: YebC/PmpR family DNA-binding transcriptional regulator [FCB group bacterium]|jgi:YebC/PmpR family DNA-binding regulatory protein|nr:YebC/PmpR family DNA-binding transcriptional regulator [FCB group bacterium]